MILNLTDYFLNALEMFFSVSQHLSGRKENNLAQGRRVVKLKSINAVFTLVDLKETNYI
jgi:hypothetical protein